GRRTLSKETAAQTLAGVAAGTLPPALLPWVSLMNGANAPEVVREWRRLVEARAEEALWGDYAWIVLVFAGLANCADVWKTGLEGWNVKTSQIVEDWKAEGEAKGRAEAQLQTSQAKLLRALQMRFGPDLPVEVEQAVAGQLD